VTNSKLFDTYKIFL